MEKLYNNYPDICVSKKDLKANYFSSISIKTIERRLDESQKTKEFKDISFRTGQKVLINVRGFYLFLLHRERVRYIWLEKMIYYSCWLEIYSFLKGV